MSFGVLELGVTLVCLSDRNFLLSDRNFDPPPFQTPVVMTQGGGGVSEPLLSRSDETALFHGLRVDQGC